MTSAVGMSQAGQRRRGERSVMPLSPKRNSAICWRTMLGIGQTRPRCTPSSAASSAVSSSLMASSSRPPGFSRVRLSCTTLVRKGMRLPSSLSPSSAISARLTRGLRRSRLVAMRVASFSSGRMGGLKAMASNAPGTLANMSDW